MTLGIGLFAPVVHLRLLHHEIGFGGVVQIHETFLKNVHPSDLDPNLFEAVVQHVEFFHLQGALATQLVFFNDSHAKLSLVRIESSPVAQIDRKWAVGPPTASSLKYSSGNTR